MIQQVFNPIAELVAPEEIPTNEAKAEIQTQPVKAEAKINMYSAVLINLLQQYVLISYRFFYAS